MISSVYHSRKFVIYNYHNLEKYEEKPIKSNTREFLSLEVIMKSNEENPSENFVFIITKKNEDWQRDDTPEFLLSAPNTQEETLKNADWWAWHNGRDPQDKNHVRIIKIHIPMDQFLKKYPNGMHYPQKAIEQLLEENKKYQKIAENPNINKTETSSSFDVSKCKIILFQPDEEFYHNKNFDERLKILEEKIIAAKEYLKANSEPDTVALFAAPEYLFKDLNVPKEGYYSQEQKNRYKNKLIELSKDTDMIIAPGTICWGKEAKADKRMGYRNVIYFVHQGTIQKYSKSEAHPYYDNYPNSRQPNSFFKTGTADSTIKNINGLTLGVEICLDSICRLLYRHVQKNPQNLNIQLVVADGADKATILPIHNLLYVQVERDAKKNVIGIVEKNYAIGFLRDKQVTQFQIPNHQDLSCCTFSPLLDLENDIESSTKPSTV